MISRRSVAATLGLCAGTAWLLASGCVRTPKYSHYVSPFKDFVCEVPTGWSVVREGSRKDYYELLFVGPFEPSFYHGVPSLSVRWYRINAPHRLPDGTYEIYSSYQDFMNQMLRDVYGPDGYYKGGSDKEQEAAAARGEELPDYQRIKVPDDKHVKAGEKQVLGFYFVAYHDAPAGKDEKDGVRSDDQGHCIVRERHGYIVLPVRGGFYLLTYPATSDGFEKYRPEFFQMINTFRLVRAGPA